MRFQVGRDALDLPDSLADQTIMCGIAGIYYFNGEKRVDQASLKAMADALVHRGPDDDGYFHMDSLGFAHRRLSIIDLAGGHQPLFNEDKSIALICNGEVFDFRPQQAALQAKGHRLATHSDSEVIVHLYEDHGIDVLQHLRGQYALALYDQKKKTLLLARDRVGEKPLYYYRDAQRIIFASEMKAILALKGLQLTKNFAGIPHYLRDGYFAGDQTQFCEIKKLPPGHFLKITDGVVGVPEAYWQMPPLATSAAGPVDFSQTLQALDQHIREAIAIRMVSDVPLGAFLSGGVDSSLVVAIMQQLSTQKVKTFNISFRESEFDEAPYARQVAAHLGTEHHEIPVDYQIRDLIEKVLRHFDEPFADSSAIPTYLVSQAAKRFVTVVLSGDAGDEFFMGYRRYLGRKLSATYNQLPAILRRSVFNISRRAIKDESVYIGHSVKKMFLRFLYSAHYYEQFPDGSVLPFFTDAEMKNLLKPEIVASLGLRETPETVEHLATTEALARMVRADQMHYLPEDILVKVDRMSMFHALEVRPPLLDHKLVAFAAGLPLGFKLHGRTGKYILKKLSERYLPKEIIYRRKQGFAIPISQWWKGELRDLLHDELICRESFYNRATLETMVAQHESGRADYGQHFWALLALRYGME